MMAKLLKNDYTDAKLTIELTEREQIINFLTTDSSNTKLSPTQQAKLDRYDRCDNLLRKGSTRDEIVKIWAETYKLSRRQAYYDIEATEQIFGSVRSKNKDYYFFWLRDKLIETIEKAWEQEKWKEVVLAEKELRLLYGFGRETDQAIDPSLFQQNILMVNMDPESIGLPKIKNLEQKIKKFKAKKKPEIQDTEIGDEE